MRRARLTAAVLLAVQACGPTPKPEPPVRDRLLEDLVRLIPRRTFFASPGRARPLLSPDGRLLAFLAPWQGVVNLWVQPVQDVIAHKRNPKRVTAQSRRGLSRYFWARDSRSLFYLQDTGGDENFRLHQVWLATGKTRLLTPKQGVRTRIVALSKRHPDEILIALNKRSKRLFDVYRLHVPTGRLTLDTPNPGQVLGWLADFDFQIRAARAVDERGQWQLLVRDTVRSPWRVLRTWGPLEYGRAVGFTRDGGALYVAGNKGTRTHHLKRVEIATGKTTLLAGDPRVDLSPGVMINRDDFTVEAVGFELRKLRWRVLDLRVRADYAALRRLAGRNTFRIHSRTRDDRSWLVSVRGDVQPRKYFLYDRRTRRSRYLFCDRPEVTGWKLAPTESHLIRARDGLKLLTYLTFPHKQARRRLPAVLLVHGGPWARDHWGYNPYVQWLANRGYLVLQVNFRGSAGFGKAFLNAGNREWGRAMQHDLTDAVRWAIGRGFAHPRRVAIMGSSYGGYAALAGVAFTPKRYAAAVAIVGPSNLVTLLRSIPPYWQPLRAMFRVRVGDLQNPTDLALLKRRSPLFAAHRIRTPLLVFQGQNDPRVKIRESDQMVRAIRKRGGQVRYVVYEGEGHGLRRPQNRLDLTARIESFLARHLGGRAEPAWRLQGSTARER